jgi:hypothetical protein
MRVKLQLVMCNDEGEEETVTDVITLNKNNQRRSYWIPGSYVTRSSMSAGSNALPRFRTL